MDPIATLMHLSAIHILMAMLPGPNTVVVSYCSASLSRRSGLTAALGVASASLVWLTLSLAGISVLLMQVGDLFRVARLAGALYLVYVGVRMLRSRGGSLEASGRPVYRSPFMAGALTTLSNPKSAIFWTSVFSVVLPSEAPGWFYLAVVALIGAQAFLWYSAVALVFSAPFSRKQYARVSTALNRIAGIFMVLFGLKIADELRREIVIRV
ncbi:MULTISPECIES: LysE family translocator [Alphaproteobacteria]|uniref:LysE type translocator n=2 Tax=Alphaproteobacteria TaxID=28211 RepID=A0A512HF74_9HYPH|nr:MULTISPECIES: LysE family transporter [Alphaproteobacteria]GEO84114.1 LysE type translocator [Ciceribacter naphthalenivorans]GLR24650.1 LysE type translocator [Ciceribacter naphthalenivorans]GLT07506.1 LysE type translocator [Sphingomonas psychrolutea]